MSKEYEQMLKKKIKIAFKHGDKMLNNFISNPEYKN